MNISTMHQCQQGNQGCDSCSPGLLLKYPLHTGAADGLTTGSQASTGINMLQVMEVARLKSARPSPAPTSCEHFNYAPTVKTVPHEAPRTPSLLFQYTLHIDAANGLTTGSQASKGINMFPVPMVALLRGAWPSHASASYEYFNNQVCGDL